MIRLDLAGTGEMTEGGTFKVKIVVKDANIAGKRRKC